MKLKIFKTKKVKTPIRSGVNAGFDFFVPNDLEDFIIEPGDQINIPSGIKVRIPKNHCLIAFNKSGIASHYSLIVGACVIDENYTGEIHLNVINVGNRPVVVSKEQKLIQFILIKQNYIDIKEYKDEEELYKNFNTKERGNNGFGSSGLY
tara:strand:- start:269 stop:718 length:450 start_codon:yes stop_codon:yes gene_type:complete